MCFVVPSSIILRALPDVKDDNGRARHSRSLVGFQRIASAMLRDGGVRNLLEVKSSTKAKPEHETDAAIQTYVVEGAGLRVGKAFVGHLDETYVREGGDYDLDALFALDDVTKLEIIFYIYNNLKIKPKT